MYIFPMITAKYASFEWYLIFSTLCLVCAVFSALIQFILFKSIFFCRDTSIPKLGFTVTLKFFQWHQNFSFSSCLFLSYQGRWKFNFFKDPDLKAIETDILILSISVTFAALFFGIIKSFIASKRLSEYLLFHLTSCLGPKK